MTADVPRPHYFHGFFRNRYSAEKHGPSLKLLKFFWRMRAVSAQGEISTPLKPDVAWLKKNRSTAALTWPWLWPPSAPI